MYRHSPLLIPPCPSCLIQQIGYLIIFLNHQFLPRWLLQSGIVPLNLLPDFLSYPLCIKTIIVHCTLRDAPREPEVADLHPTSCIDQNVCTLQIAMHYVTLMDEAKAAQKIVNDLEDVRFFQMDTLLHDLVQVCVHVVQNKAEGDYIIINNKFGSIVLE